MNTERVVKKLAHLYGERVEVRSAYHIQVLSDKGPHDVWVKKDRTIKFRSAGDNTIHEDISFEKIVKMIGSSKKTKVEKMKEMLDIAAVVGVSEKAAEFIGDAIFTDAGFKNGKARIAAVMVKEGEIQAKCLKDAQKAQVINNIQDAERLAIIYGLRMDKKLTVYNDNKSVCEAMNHPRVKWLSRDLLKAPDKLANMRGNV